MSRKVKTIVLAALIASGLLVAFAAGWFSRPVWDRGIYKTVAHIPDPFLASDNKGYLGVVVSECREWDTKKPISYKIQRPDGSVIERPAQGISIYVP
ncbi:MAG: hypothetical protein ABJC10_11485 [Acidobacteriota bacterium]